MKEFWHTATPNESDQPRRLVWVVYKREVQPLLPSSQHNLLFSRGYFEKQIDPRRRRLMELAVEPAEALQHRQLAVGRVDFFAGFQFDGANFQHVLGPFVQQFDDLRIQPVNRLAVLGDVHCPGRVQKEDRRIKPVRMSG